MVGSRLSSHTRGTPVLAWPSMSCTGLIPAHAGNTTPDGWRKASKPAHPRTRGEHQTQGLPGALERGSSPHTRGTQTRAKALHHMDGLIPAHAGNTSLLLAYLLQILAHPRTRGEHWSPPLAPSPPGGLIPAHAGNTELHVKGHTTDQGSSPHTRGTRP